jgi:5'-deoxynucleotidase YfbR-like HD superfamily hydrolase
MTTKSWIRTWPTRRAFDVLKPTASMVHPLDIAHHLGMLCRFTGGCRNFYSVAEHCYWVSIRAEEIATKLRGSFLMNQNVIEAHVAYCARWGLLHDASEAYIADLNRPTKHSPGLEGYRQLEDGILIAIAERFSLSLPMPAEVKQADDEMLFTERRDLLETPDPEWDATIEVPREPLASYKVRMWLPGKARKMWLKRFAQLFPEEWEKIRMEFPL